MSVIKRRKTSEYLQLHNYPVQEDLGDLSAIGLLTYIMSLPEDWKLRKTQLQAKFSRRKVDGSWKLLAEKKYAIGFACYVNGKKSFYYSVSDVAFEESEFQEFVIETMNELAKTQENLGKAVPMPDSPYQDMSFFTDVQNVQQSENTDVHFVQYKMYSTNCTVQNVHLQINKDKEIDTKEIDTKKHDYQFDNYQGGDKNSDDEFIYNRDEFERVFKDTCNDLYGKYAAGRWNKSQWSTLITQYVNELIESYRFAMIPKKKYKAYAESSIKRMAERHDNKKVK